MVDLFIPVARARSVKRIGSGVESARRIRQIFWTEFESEGLGTSSLPFRRSQSALTENPRRRASATVAQSTETDGGRGHAASPPTA